MVGLCNDPILLGWCGGSRRSRFLSFFFVLLHVLLVVFLNTGFHVAFHLVSGDMMFLSHFRAISRCLIDFLFGHHSTGGGGKHGERSYNSH